MSLDVFRRKGFNRVVSATELTHRTDAMNSALRFGGDRLPADEVAKAEEVAKKLSARTAILGSRTVVALAGATGSGKSSLFNSLVGEPVSRIGARRPTTSLPSAAVWGSEPSDELLNWLKVGARHQVPATSAENDALDGLVLLDLPDFDSRVSAHREEADRVIDLADVFVWVTDPQKYADAVLHEEYVQRLTAHKATTIVVLNQIDRLPRDAVQSCVQDLEKLLAADGLSKVEVIATSAVRGSGREELISRIATIVQGHNAAEQRLLGDLQTQARILHTHVAQSETNLSDRSGAGLTDALCRAAGVPVVVDAVARDYRMNAAGYCGSPFTRWAAKMRPAPLSRLGLDKVVLASMSRKDANLATGRSSLPPATPAAKAAVDVAIRSLSSEAAEGLPQPWADAIYDAANPGDAEMHDALDQAVVSTPLRERNPAWWFVVGALQWVFAAVAVAGLVWLLILAGLGFAQIHLDTPTFGWIPVPLLLLVGGLLAGLLLALVSRWIAARAAQRRAHLVERRLRKAVQAVGQQQVVAPVDRVLRDHRLTREHLETVAG